MNIDDIVDIVPDADAPTRNRTDRARENDESGFWYVLAKIFSIILQPLLMPFYTIMLLYTYTNFFHIYQGFVWKIIGIILIFTFVIPSLFVLVLKSFGIVKDLALSDKKDRFLPYGLTCFSNMSMVYYFHGANFHSWFIGILAAPVLVLILGAIINAFWKVSARMMGIGSLAGITMTVSFLIFKLNPFPLFMLLFIIAGCLGTSRIYLKQNTPLQVYVGFLVGFFASSSVVWMSIQNIMYI